MNAKEFVNYLKGGIELGQLSQLDENGFNLLFNKLKEVKQDSTPESGFCTWLQGVLDTSDNPEVSVKKMNLIEEKLSQINSAPKPEPKKTPTHNSPGNSDFLVRC